MKFISTERLTAVFVGMVLALISTNVFSQKVTLYGTVKDSLTGENLIGAYIRILETNQVITTNNYGFYSITFNSGNYTISCSFVGYAMFVQTTNLGKSTKCDIELSPEIRSMDEVIVRSNRSSINTTTVSKNVIPVEQIKSITAVSGEPDVLKSLQLLPGVQTAGEGSANLNVRGGSFDQNLILLDEAPVYNPSHALGFFSTFNTDAINHVSFYKGAFPAQYGGRLSSVVDVSMKEGNDRKYSVNGGVGLVASRLTIEGPIIKDKASFILSGRYSYAGQMLNLLAGSIGSDLLHLHPLRNFNDKNDIRFYDLNAKINYRINDNNHFYISTYTGGDRFYSYSLNGNNALEWGNSTSTIRWNHIFNSRLFSNFTTHYSNYNYAYHIYEDIRNFIWKSNIKEAAVKADFSAYPNVSNKVRFGLSAIYHHFEPGRVEPYTATSILTPYALGNKSAVEAYAYLSNEQNLYDRISVEYGIRYTGFINIGPDTVFQYTADKSQVTGFKAYDKGAIVQFYQSLEPRISARYLFNKHNSIKIAYGYTSQFLHLLSNSSLGLPTDLWMPPGNSIEPQSSNQFVLGYYHALENDNLEFSTELYYKSLHHIIDYKDNADLFLNKHIETQILTGDGYSYGNEYMLEKKSGKLKGWVAYTYSKTQYKIEGINKGDYFSPRWDIRHNLSITGNYAVSLKWRISSTFKYTSGGFVTVPEGSFTYAGASFNYYTERNGYQLKPYHRLDISATYRSVKNESRKWKSEWLFSIYNIYNRKNTYALFVRQEGYLITSSNFYQMYLFGIVPTITYNFKF